MIGIKKQTAWYINKAKAIDAIREEINPCYGLTKRMGREVYTMMCNVIWFGNTTRVKGITHINYN